MSPKDIHSAPSGGPARSWTNDQLTEALENVWNKRMTTSQASKTYNIPYSSLQVYVKGKYGKSLKLDKLKNTTLAAHDTNVQQNWTNQAENIGLNKSHDEEQSISGQISKSSWNQQVDSRSCNPSNNDSCP